MSDPLVRPFTVAVMQPYFIPYAGYFRLFAASDLFVVYDCVQFPRRGWVHRNRLSDATGVERWLTLPVAKMPRATRICDLRFQPNAPAILAARLRRFPLLARAPKSAGAVLEALREVDDTPVGYLERLLQRVVTYLGLPWNTIRSSELHLPDPLRGQDRIVEICRLLQAQRYVNVPGGRSLYRRQAFADSGIQLSFLSDYPGPASSILTRIVLDDREDLAQDIRVAARDDGP